MPFGAPDTFEAAPAVAPWPTTPVVKEPIVATPPWPVAVAPWPVSATPVVATPVATPVEQDDKETVLKKQFALELTKKANPFEAACAIFKDTKDALWVSQNWINDDIVLAAKDAYNAPKSEKLLDKNDLSRKLLAFSEEKDPTGRFHIHDGKDRLSALKLYAEVQGFIGKVEVDASTKNFTNNTMKIVLVGTKKDAPTIENTSSDNDDVPKTILPTNIKLVSAR